VTFGYTETRFLLKGANFVIRKGLKLTLMGQNGAGKSTLFSLITGEREITEGRMVKENDQKSSNRQTNYSTLNVDLSVRDFSIDQFGKDPTQPPLGGEEKCKKFMISTDVQSEPFLKLLNSLFLFWTKKSKNFPVVKKGAY
jgi:ATPase subunit of ABC transporter with duplicated ATPase domains